MTKPAILGGDPVRTKPFPPHPMIGEEEKKAVLEVLESGKLSTFLAVPGEHFLGGKKIKELERRFAEYHDVPYAIAFNSATAALHAAVVASGVQPEHEVIVPPYTFTSTATCALMHNAIPVFADIEDETYGLDPAAVQANLSPLTQAIIAVHLFGHPSRIEELADLAARRGLKLIEDCAQAPGARVKGRPVGTIGDCGIFSFTENKNITTGEGGMLITRDQRIAEVAQLVRNHGEMVSAGQSSRSYNSEILGWNYRLTEMDAALGIVQFGRMDSFNRARAELAEYLSGKLEKLPGFRVPRAKPDSTHAYYIYAIKYDESRVGIPRNLFVRALVAEGIPFGAGYVRPLYLTSLYHEGKPFAFKHYTGHARYDKGICPVAERMHELELIQTQIARPPATQSDMKDVVIAFEKLVEHRDQLCKLKTC